MRFLRTLIRFAASLAALWLLLAFVIRVFSPGNVDTEVIFKAIAIIQPILDAGVALLVFPVQWALDFINPYLPAGVKSWFPITQAASFFKALCDLFLKIPGLAITELGRQLQQVQYKTIFPGVLDWRLLMAIGLWGFVEAQLLKVIIWIEAKQYRNHIRQRDADILAGFRDKK